MVDKSTGDEMAMHAEAGEYGQPRQETAFLPKDLVPWGQENATDDDCVAAAARMVACTEVVVVVATAFLAAL